MYNPDSRREILGTTDILNKVVNDVVALVENKEMARNALPSSSLSAVLSFQRQKTQQLGPVAPPPPADQAREDVCPDCKHTFKVFTEGRVGGIQSPIQFASDALVLVAGKDARSARPSPPRLTSRPSSRT